MEEYLATLCMLATKLNIIICSRNMPIMIDVSVNISNALDGKKGSILKLIRSCCEDPTF